MAQIGYWIASEEHKPDTMVSLAQRAEELGFPFIMVSDHYHPWTDRQGNSPFVWSVLGGIASTTKRIHAGTAVTCPIMRIHPAVLAQAAATTTAMMPGRFFLGVGSGEALNEHILGDKWPPLAVRNEMLEEAVEIMRELWQGGLKSHEGPYFLVENARLYTLPPSPPPVMMAAGGQKAATLAGRIADGLIGVSVSKEVMQTFDSNGGAGKPRYAEVTMCWSEDEARGRRTAWELWPQSGLQGQVFQELALPSYFEQVSRIVTEDDIAKTIPSGPEVERYVDKIKRFVEGGFTHLALHQIGPEQEGFFRFYQTRLLPALKSAVSVE